MSCPGPPNGQFTAPPLRTIHAVSGASGNTLRHPMHVRPAGVLNNAYPCYASARSAPPEAAGQSTRAADPLTTQTLCALRAYYLATQALGSYARVRNGPRAPSQVQGVGVLPHSSSTRMSGQQNDKQTTARVTAPSRASLHRACLLPCTRRDPGAPGSYIGP